MTFLDVFWSMLVAFAFLANLVVMVMIVSDLFRDHTTSGGMKAVWVVFLFLLPFVTALVYLVVKGPGMARRGEDRVRETRERDADYVRSLVSSPADEIARAQELLDRGAIDADEFGRLKAKALR